jgi:hypothetical protein
MDRDDSSVTLIFWQASEFPINEFNDSASYDIRTFFEQACGLAFFKAAAEATLKQINNTR